MIEELIIKRFDTSLPLPERKTAGSVGYDLTARLDVTIPPGSTGRVPLNVAVQLPDGYWGLLAVRSSLHKRGLLPANGIGIIDADYAGDNDEYQLLLYNSLSEPVTLARGERIAQLVPVPYRTFPVHEVQTMPAAPRGGLGSTGNR